MSEKLSYDLDVAQQAVVLHDAYKQAVDAHAKVLEDKSTVDQLQQLHSMGPVKRFGSRKVIKELEQRAPIYHYEVDGKPMRAYITQSLHTTEGELKDALRSSEGHLHENAGAYYDNAVIEANNDFINQRRQERIMTPQALQDLADTALRGMAPEQAISSNPEHPVKAA